MASENQEQVYLVDAYNDPVWLKVNGRASYLNCAPLNEFFNGLIKKGKINFVLDLQDCTSMDSTFLGLVAGVAIELRKPEHKESKLILCNLGERNLELVENLGLHLIVDVREGQTKLGEAFFTSPKGNLSALEGESTATMKTILDAHENLVAVHESNLNKFQDVLSYLKTHMHSERASET